MRLQEAAEGHQKGEFPYQEEWRQHLVREQQNYTSKKPNMSGDAAKRFEKTRTELHPR